jgi:NFU1 iron-sulfur cluster scaffold homolog, mitochondrial
MSEAWPVEPPISIRAEVSLADPDTCKFTVNRTVHLGGPFFFESRDHAAGSPLVERLFQLPGVAHVLVAGNVVTVGKESHTAWSGLNASIGAVIRSQLLTGICAILESPLRAGASKRSDAEVRATVQDLLDRVVNRSIASHGGQISIVDVRDGKLLIAMSGGCQGCTASQVTLKDGFELMVRRIAPEIVDIVDTTDHAAGKKPFYARAGEAR